MVIKLSIIVPVYNVEEYIIECIDSVISQTFKDWELILVDDGSTDNSGKICDEYATKDSRIKVIHKKNGGLSSARNTGLDIAKGEYITFIDSDDLIAHNTIEENIKILESNMNIDIVQYPTYNKYGCKNEYVNIIPSQNIIGEENLWKFFFKYGCYTIWDKFYRRKIFNNIRFTIDIKFEDTYIIPDIFKIAKGMFISTEGCYYYRYREGSITNSNISYTYIKDKIFLNNKLYYYFERSQNLKFYKANIIIMIIDCILYAKIHLNNSNFNKLFKEEIKSYDVSLIDVLRVKITIKQKTKLLIYKIIGIRLLSKFYYIYNKCKNDL